MNTNEMKAPAARGRGQRESAMIPGEPTEWVVGYFVPGGKRELTVTMRVPNPSGGWEVETVMFKSEKDALMMCEFWTHHPHREGAFDYIVRGLA